MSYLDCNDKVVASVLLYIDRANEIGNIIIINIISNVCKFILLIHSFQKWTVLK